MILMLIKLKEKDIADKVVHKRFALIPLRTHNNCLVWLSWYYVWDDTRQLYRDIASHYRSKSDFYYSTFRT